MNLILLLMLDPWSSVLECLERDAKATEFVSLSSKLPSVPTIEVSENCETFCSRAPLHEVDVIVWLEVQTKFLIGSCDVLKTTFSSLENVKPPGKKLIRMNITYFLYSFYLRKRSFVKGAR